MYCDHPGFLRLNLSYNAQIDHSERLVAGEMLVSDIIARLRQRNLIKPMGQLVALPSKGSASHLTLGFTNPDAYEHSNASGQQV